MSSNEAVVAGSPEFVDAMLPVFTQRLGGAPRVADTPHLASALCQDGARLLVYEHAGREWLSLCADLRGIAGPDLLVVVALPPEHAADVAQISSSASAVVAWRGEVQPVLDAANRVLAARDAPPPAARRTGPVLTPQPSRSPILTPQPVRSPVLTPQPTRSPLTTPQPTRATARPSPTPPPGPAADPFDNLFEEMGVTDAAVPAPPPPAAVAAPIPPPSAPPPLAVWPGTVLSATDGQAVVRAALSGLWPEPSLLATTRKVVESLSAAEKAAVLGQKLSFDPAPVRRSVGLRWQVAVALDTLPAQGAEVDRPAVQAILGGIDEVLAQLKVVTDDAGPDTLRVLEAIRHDLVKEAIDLTEALQKLLPAEVVEEITTSRKARQAEAAPATRMVHAAPVEEAQRGGLPWGLITLLILSIAAAVAYHGYRYVNRTRPSVSEVSGAPTGTVGKILPQGKVVVAPAGAKLDPKEIENFKNLERAKGNEVREVLPGTFVVSPPVARPEKAAGSGEPQTQGARP